MAARKPTPTKKRHLLPDHQRKVTKIKVLEKVRDGKSRIQIVNDLAINRNTVSEILHEAEKVLAPKERRQFHKLLRENAAIKFKPANARNLIHDSKNVLVGKSAFLLQKPKDPLAKFYMNKPAATKKAIRLIRKTNMRLVQIKKETGLSKLKISNLYHIIKQMESIPERKTGSNQKRDKKRITKWYRNNKKKVQKLMQIWEPKIVSTAASYCRNSTIFQRTGIYPDNIADYIRDSLEWKLKTFDPSRGKKMSEDIKLRNHISHQIKLLALDQLKIARKRKAQVSLGYNLTKSQKKPWTFMDILVAKPSARNTDPEKLIALIEEVSKKAGFSIQEKAIIYAKAAGLKQHQIGKIVGVNESRISQVMISIRAKATKAGFSPKK